jgi:hypothetical protein
MGTAWRLGVSGRNRCLRKWIVGSVESLSEAADERAVVDALSIRIADDPRGQAIAGGHFTLAGGHLLSKLTAALLEHEDNVAR